MRVAFRLAGFLVPAFFLALLATPTAAQREPVDRDVVEVQGAASMPYCIATYDVGQFILGVTNYGMIGIARGKGDRIDCFTGRALPKGEYPKGSRTVYLYTGGLWVGGVVGRDTLVSEAVEFNTLAREFHPTEPMRKFSTLDYQSAEFSQAVSEQDFVAVYTDTFRNVGFGSFDPIANRPHKPLGLRVEQSSHAWSYGHTDDFLIMTFRITNISDKPIDAAYVGMYWDPDVHTAVGDFWSQPDATKPVTKGYDDLAGFFYDAVAPLELCEARDTIALAWTADNDGDYSSGEFLVPHVAGLRLLGPDVTDPTLRLSYNWWVYNYNSAYDFGPQMIDHFRDLGNGIGTPYGDRNRYFLMANGERDYSMPYTYSVPPAGLTWAYPDSRTGYRMSSGADVQQLLSIGPRRLPPGAEVEFAVAVVFGEFLHKDRYNHRDNIGRKYQPDAYLAGLDFSSLIANAVTAGRVYDVPGLDSNEDGYAGKFRLCVLDSELVDGEWVASAVDTSYYEGDGVPDLLAAAPPPSPEFSLEPIRNGFRVHINGSRSETTRDVFSGEEDFEGYRMYLARDNRDESFSLVGQYDRLNFDKHVYLQQQYKEPGFYRVGTPMTLEEVRCHYGEGLTPCEDSSFDPLRFTATDPYFHPLHPDSIFFFTAHDYNQSEFGVNTSIRKVYPDQPPPSSLLNPREDELTEEGRLKYYEYEAEIVNLLPSVPYFVSVTAFDYGSPQAGLAPLESSRTVNSRNAYPNNAWDEKADSVSNVYVYPNPYRHDAYYRVLGYEGRGQDDRSRDRVRKITFANLPAECRISIYTLDGDLVREMDHEMAAGDPNASYHEWDMITRNVQMVVSGMYYWVVETPDGQRQMGKLVILL